MQMGIGASNMGFDTKKVFQSEVRVTNTRYKNLPGYHAFFFLLVVVAFDRLFFLRSFVVIYFRVRHGDIFCRIDGMRGLVV